MASVGRLAAALPTDVALIGFAGAAWTLAHYMVEGRGGSDGATVRRWAWREPDTFQVLITLLVEANAAYLQRQIEAGAEVVQLFDSWAGGLPETQFRRWVIEPTRQIVERCGQWRRRCRSSAFRAVPAPCTKPLCRKRV